ncbi:DeoR/GlpR family DNA-binding transcription regulator [Staphylococcus simulans]|nr:DeoR/GlpR family DNA-binding transcription regulator [Staphylococcus simulans]
MKIFADERRELIMTYLSKHKRATVNQLSEYAKVTPATIRTDLTALQSLNKVERTHGGVKLSKIDTSNVNNSFSERLNKHQSSKQKIGMKALEKIQNHQCILLDASSTTYELAKLLAKTDMKLTIITNGLESALLLKENSNLTILIIGGFAKKGSNALTGRLDSQILDMYHIDYFFVSANGITIQNGLTDFSLSEVELKKEMIQQSAEVIALIDKSKFNISSTLSFAKLSDVSEIITDEKLSNKLMNEIPAKVTKV